MAPYYKYEVIYTREPNGSEQIILVCLGLLKSERRPIVTPKTYAFKIFSSQLKIDDLSQFLNNEYEYKHSVMHYIGNLYTFEEYSNLYKTRLRYDAVFEKNHSVVVTRTVGDENDKKAYVVKNVSAFRVLPYHSIQFNYTHVGTSKLSVDYQIAVI